jgi:hypothetical protein
MALSEVLEAADQLSMEEQETLIEVLRRRLSDLRRQHIVRDVRESREAFAAGECQPATPQEILEEILS